MFYFFVNVIKGVFFIKFYSNGDGGCRWIDKGFIIMINMVRCIIFVEIEFLNDLFFDIWVGVCSDDLE